MWCQTPDWLVSRTLALCKAMKRRMILAGVVWTVGLLAIFRYTAWSGVAQEAVAFVNARHILHRPESRTSGGSVSLEELLKLQPLVDTSPSLSEVAVLNNVKQHVTSLPVDFWLANRKKVMRLNSTCAKLPNIYDLKFNNIYWQVMESSNGTYNFYSAYYDNRTKLSIRPLVRMLVMIDRIRPTLKTQCQLWFANSQSPVIAPVFEYKYVWNEKWGNFRQGVLQPYLMACQIPASHMHQTPQAVTVVEGACATSTVAMKVINNVPSTSQDRQDFAVCVKGLSFPDQDISVRMVEWIEMLNILGAKKIFIYELDVHPNISKVLRYYQKQGLVDVTPLTLAGEQPNLSILQRFYLGKKITNKRQSELVPYNDCFYRNMYKYEYIALMDTDEVIMPTRHNSWSKLLEDVRSQAQVQTDKTQKEFSSYNARNVYFLGASDDNIRFRDIPRYMHMLQHVYRSENYTKPGHYVKSFHRTDLVIALHNHFPLACMSGCRSFNILTSDAHLQHYRSDCVSSLKKVCESYKSNVVLDTNIWRFKEELTVRVTRTLIDLGFLPPEGEGLVEYFQTGGSGRVARAVNQTPAPAVTIT